jgi:mitogen-activated protein kinase kinase
VNLEEWAIQMMERHNRKSHLAPQLSPSTQSLLLGESIGSPSKESSASKTPTSGEIPIAGDDVKHSPPPELVTAQHLINADTNGTSAYHATRSSYERPMFPPRSSSNSTLQVTRPRDGDNFSPPTSFLGRTKDTDGFPTTTALPIRPAPPPSGPLPAPPGSSFRTPNSRRQASTGLSYTNGEAAPY